MMTINEEKLVEKPLTSDRGLLDVPDAEDWSPMKDPSPMKKPNPRSDDIFFVKGPLGKGL